MYISILLTALISSMLINNVLLMRFLGICPFLGVSKKVEASLGMSAAVGFVMLVASIISWFIYYFVLLPLNVEYLSIITFILVIASLVQFVEMVIKKYSPKLYKSLGIYLPLITTNCAILGVAQGNIIANYSFDLMLVNTIGTALGFALIMFAFSAIREKLEISNVPNAFKGVPIALIVAGFMALAFAGLGGLI